MRSQMVLLPFLLATIVFPQNAPTNPKSSAEHLAAIHSAFLGTWTGAFQYRDSPSDPLVIVPTWLNIKLSPDRRSMEFNYLYDDGSSKPVQETTRVTLDLDKSTFSVTSENAKDADVYQMSGADKLSSSGLGTLVMTGSGIENKKRVEVRITLRLGRNDYHYFRETRLPGESFQTRDAYNFTRRDPPPS